MPDINVVWNSFTYRVVIAEGGPKSTCSVLFSTVFLKLNLTETLKLFKTTTGVVTIYPDKIVRPDFYFQHTIPSVKKKKIH